MEPNDSVNIDRFLTAYHHCGTFIVMPAVLRTGEPPELLFRLGIVKREISFKLAANVGDEDIEAIALRVRARG
jgi:hypothetical protein